MTANDPAWSVFWTRGSAQSNPPDANNLYTGKHVGEDAAATRANETIGYIVVESGTHVLGSTKIVAGVGSDIVRGVDNSPPYTYAVSGLGSVCAAILTNAGMDGGDGGWIVHTAAPTATNLSLAVNEDQVGDTERSHTTEQAAYLVVEQHNPNLSAGIIPNVDASWQTVTLGRAYKSMVVVATPVYDKTKAPAVVRIRNAAGNSFEIRLQNPGDTATLSAGPVHYVVVEEGVYTQAEHGIQMEAVKYLSSVTDSDSSWVGESQTYSNTYANPAVFGQVMTANDTAWSVFWARGSSSTNPPDATHLYTGKHVAEDATIIRTNETVGYIVIESGIHTFEGLSIVAGTGPDTVKGVTDGTFNYTYSGLSSITAAVLGTTGMDGVNGGWAVQTAAPAVGSLTLGIDEDQIGDAERAHTTEQASYLAVGAP